MQNPWCTFLLGVLFLATAAPRVAAEVLFLAHWNDRLAADVYRTALHRAEPVPLGQKPGYAYIERISLQEP